MYKDVAARLMDAEKLLELFQTKPTITDKKGAKPLKLENGEIVFKDVNYSYDPRKPSLKNINFVIKGGTTVALVGETGSGKSTILKLIDRLYDINSGSITIDGQDVRDVTVKRYVIRYLWNFFVYTASKIMLMTYSLRSKIGVVPQNANLSSDNVMENVRYAKLQATDEDVQEACKAAAIHEKIMTFPDGKPSCHAECFYKALMQVCRLQNKSRETWSVSTGLNQAR